MIYKYLNVYIYIYNCVCECVFCINTYAYYTYSGGFIDTQDEKKVDDIKFGKFLENQMYVCVHCHRGCDC